MPSLINFFTTIIYKIYSILNVRFFSDFPLTYMDILILSFVIPFLFKFIYGGFHEINVDSYRFNNYFYNGINYHSRKKELSKEKKDKK